jgi:hypothetical protein
MSAGAAGRWTGSVAGTVLLAAGAAGVPAVVPGRLIAQGIHADVGRLLEADGWTTYRLGVEHRVAGPVSLAVYGTHLSDESALRRRHWGGGTDLVLRPWRRSGPYLLGGLAGGFSSDSLDEWWHSWSAGGGYQLALGGVIALAGEARWRNVDPGRRNGVELSLRIGALFGGAGGTRRAPTPPPTRVDLPPAPDEGPAVLDPPVAPPGAMLEPPRQPLATAAPAAGIAVVSRFALADSVVTAALDALGTGYRLGGTTTAGFDCSGLIQHAYARHGIRLPRVSRDQAKAGKAVKRDLDALRPGDILTFAQRGRRITHVGLYLGDGRFVHSARGGVQVSALSDSDPQGRWYWKRWIGARRIVTSDEQQ